MLNWLQDYDNLLEMCDEEDKLYERLELWDSIEEIFDLNNKVNLYWKERTIREKANTEFRLGNEEKATKMIEEYLNEKENWVWGYIEMADWYTNTKKLEEIAKQTKTKQGRIEKMSTTAIHTVFNMAKEKIHQMNGVNL